MDDETEEKPLSSFLYKTVIGAVNETGAFGIPPDKGNIVQYFVYTLPFYKQPVYKQTVLVC